jgi:D-hydroxyproline dehydrogenase subunit alpha
MAEPIGRPITLTFDGRPVPAVVGDSVGAALARAGVRSWRTTRRKSRPRGLFCGIGICYDCLLTVDGAANQRACLVPAVDGMDLRSSGGDRRASDSEEATEELQRSTGREQDESGPIRSQLVVVGAGPAGLAAATTAARAGLSVTLVDAGRQPGGQYWRSRLETAEPNRADDSGQHDRRTFRRLRRELSAYQAAGRIRYLPDTVVWFVESSGPDRHHVLRLASAHDANLAAGPSAVRAEAVVLCPGGYDRQLPVPGWDLPGVMAAGGVQALLKGSGVAPGRRAVIAGTGPFLLPVATGLAAAGVEVVSVCEAGSPRSWLRRPAGVLAAPDKLVEGAGYAAALLRRRIPYRPRTAVVRIHGERTVEAVTIARVDRQGRPVAGTERELAVDLVGFGWGFTPSLELVLATDAETRVDVDGSLVAEVDDRQRSSRPGVYVAGEATGVGGASLAVREGELAALTVAEDLGRPAAPRRSRRLRRAIRRARAFARAMHRAHPVPPAWPDWLDGDATVCRCEEVTTADIRHVRDDLGASDQRTVKLLARPGMGWCQGRVCGYATACLATDGRALGSADLRPLASRPLAAPVALGDLADLPALGE